MEHSPYLSVVIPVYGSEHSLRPLIERLIAVLQRTGRPFEIICVNDDSPDGAWSVLEELQKVHHDVLVAVRLMRNFGQHNATMCGFNLAKGQVTITMDDDLQHPPEELPKLLQALEDNDLDVVYGTYEQKRHSLYRNLGSSLLNWVFRRVFRIPFRFSSYRAIKRGIVDAVRDYNLNFTFIDGLLAWTTTRIGAVRVRHDSRELGRSGYRLSKLIMLALNLITNFSLAPLQIASLAGVIAALAGFGTGFAFLIAYFVGGIDVPGFASIITAVLMLGGMQLLALGTIGEYVGRLHLNFNRKPQFVIREVRGHEKRSAVAPPVRGL